MRNAWHSFQQKVMGTKNVITLTSSSDRSVLENTWVFQSQCGQRISILSLSKTEMVILCTLSGKWPSCNPKEERNTYKNNEVNRNKDFYTLLGLGVFCLIFRRIWCIRNSDTLGLWFLFKIFKRSLLIVNLRF